MTKASSSGSGVDPVICMDEVVTALAPPPSAQHTCFTLPTVWDLQ